MFDWHQIVNVGPEPWISAVESATHGTGIVIENEFPAVYPAGQLSASNLDRRTVESGDAHVGDCDSPEHGRGEIARLGSGIYVSGFVADFGRYASIALREQEHGAECKPENKALNRGAP